MLSKEGPGSLRIALAADAWQPQPNGVVRVNATVADTLRDFAPDAVQIATEGPIGRAARSCCLADKRPFSTAFHTKFPEYFSARTGLPASRFYAGLRRFHAPSSAVMAPAPAVYRELQERRFDGLRLWSHGVDTEIFRSGPKDHLDDEKLERPVFIYVGRVIGDSAAGVLGNNLREAALAALDIAPEACRQHALAFSWDCVTDQFLSFLDTGATAAPSSVPA